MISGTFRKRSGCRFGVMSRPSTNTLHLPSLAAEKDIFKNKSNQFPPWLNPTIVQFTPWLSSSESSFLASASSSPPGQAKATQSLKKPPKTSPKSMPASGRSVTSTTACSKHIPPAIHRPSLSFWGWISAARPSSRQIGITSRTITTCKRRMPLTERGRGGRAT